MRLRTWIILWILGILFPVAFLGRFWPSFGRAFEAVFSPGWMHVVMHAFLYAVLAWMLVRWNRPVSLKSLLPLVGAVVLIGCAQEGFQALASVSLPGRSAVAFDLAVDISGAAAGLGLARWRILFKRRPPADWDGQ